MDSNKTYFFGSYTLDCERLHAIQGRGNSPTVVVIHFHDPTGVQKYVLHLHEMINDRCLKTIYLLKEN